MLQVFWTSTDSKYSNTTHWNSFALITPMKSSISSSISTCSRCLSPPFLSLSLILHFFISLGCSRSPFPCSQRYFHLLFSFSSQAEQEEYTKEGVPWESIEFTDNSGPPPPLHQLLLLFLLIPPLPLPLFSFLLALSVPHSSQPVLI